MDRDDEAFLRLNANVDYMAGRLADMIRHCMRSLVSSDGGRHQIHAAMHDFVALRKLISYSDDVSFYELIEKALDELRARGEDVHDVAILDAAKAGLQLLVEVSCSDGAARGRAAKRRDHFLQSLTYIEEARQLRRRARFPPDES